MTDPSEAGPARRGLAEWVYLAALVIYTTVLFYGVGVSAQAEHWYEPGAFFSEVPGLAELLDPPEVALASFTLPALALAAMVLLVGRSAVARTAALSCVVAAPLFVFYGTVAPFVWEFFGWRGSAVLWLLSICVGLSLAAPFLAASWLRLGWPLRIAVYLPFFCGALAFIRNATGTDESLQFSISPWPAVPVFGIEVAALIVCVSLVGVALGVLGIALFRQGWGVAGAGLAVAVVAGLGGPTLLLLLGSKLEIFPFRVGPRMLLATSVVSTVLIVLAGTLRAGRSPDVLRGRAKWIAVGAALIALPLVSGQAIARYDYHVTRERDARAIIDALDAYLEKEDLYPDDLQQLVDGGYLDVIPEPRIGFGFLYDGAFRYQNFGMSFILEFPAPRWVECAYTPPYDDDYEDEEEEDDEWAEYGKPGPDENGNGESLGEAWSCPSKPPELW